MRCANNLCIYSEEGMCTLKNISVDGMGMCINCTLINIEDEELKNLKKIQLRNLNKIFIGKKI